MTRRIIVCEIDAKESHNKEKNRDAHNEETFCITRRIMKFRKRRRNKKGKIMTFTPAPCAPLFALNLNTFLYIYKILTMFRNDWWLSACAMEWVSNWKILMNGAPFNTANRRRRIRLIPKTMLYTSELYNSCSR